MLSVDEALELVLSHARPLAARRRPLPECLGLVLAEDVSSDVDSPPHDKAMVDGYAVVSADISTNVSGGVGLRVVEEVTAGDVPHHTIRRGEATRIMTGAPVPDGADAVVMVERTGRLPDEPPQAGNLGRVLIRDPNFRAGQNIMRRAASLSRGEVVLTAGSPLRAVEIGLLAEVGCSEVQVIPPVQVAVLATGNELVPPGAKPGPGQIRNSNSPMLVALATGQSVEATDLGIARDEHEELRRLIAQGLDSDVLILSGGVSAGVLDLVPAVLRELGVEQVFHKVRLKPGKPIWFGVRDRESSARTLVFGLPGNPVSSFVCFELFIRPCLDRLAGHRARSRWQSATLSEGFHHRGDRPTYHPALFDRYTNPPVVTPLRWKGSADLCGFTPANALVHFAAGDRVWTAGETVPVLPL